jgi:hypothetical protein
MRDAKCESRNKSEAASLEEKLKMVTSFHKSNLGSFGESLPCDMDGYVHLTAEAWLAAPVDMSAADRADEDYMQEWAEERAEATRLAVAESEAAVAEWQDGN